MIMMGKDKNKGGMISLILKKMRNGNNDFDSLKHSNEEAMESIPMKDGAAQDTDDAMSKSASALMEAIEQKNPAAIASSIKEMIKMSQSSHQ